MKRKEKMDPVSLHRTANDQYILVVREEEGIVAYRLQASRFYLHFPLSGETTDVVTPKTEFDWKVAALPETPVPEWCAHLSEYRGEWRTGMVLVATAP